MAFAAVAGALVEVGGPGVVVPAVVGEVGEGLAGWSVGGVPESDRVLFPAGAGDRGHTDFGGELVGAQSAFEHGADFPDDLGQVHCSDSWQGAEQLDVGVGVEHLLDRVF